MIAALKSGRVGAYGQVAEMFGVSPRSVGTSWRAFQAGGRQALPAVVRQPRAGTGELPDNLARGAVVQTKPDYTPADIGHTGVLWTRASVRVLIELVCGVSTTEQGVGTSHMAAPAWPHAATACPPLVPAAAASSAGLTGGGISGDRRAGETGAGRADQCGQRPGPARRAGPGPTGQTPLVRVNGHSFQRQHHVVIADRHPATAARPSGPGPRKTPSASSRTRCPATAPNPTG